MALRLFSAHAVRLLSTSAPIAVTLSTRRHLATTSKITTAAEAADHLLQTFSGKTLTQRQFLDANQLQKLSLTLSRPHLHPDQGVPVTSAPPAPGTPLPPGHHLVYFTPGGLETELGPDGTDRTFNAPAPFTRRMWAGGSMRWTAGGEGGEGGGGAELRVGEEAEERTRLLSASAKRSGRDGSEMVLVGVEKEFWGRDGLALVDRRSWIFRPEAKAAIEPVADPVPGKIIRGPSSVEDEYVDGEGLFRFSALTFNAHKIHYEQAWTQSMENHPACVVHGPLNLIGMLDYWRDMHKGSKVREIDYRAVSPLYAGQVYHIRMTAETDDQDATAKDILVERDGTVCTRGTIKGHEAI